MLYMAIGRINSNDVKRNLLRLASIGQDSSGAVNRVFGCIFMDQEKNEIIQYFQECGMTTSVDTVGNVHGMYSVAGEMADEIIIGSHYDSVKGGGMFDGTAGIVAAAECVREFASCRKQCLYNIHVIATNGEEGNELGGTFGSRALMGILPTENNDFLKKAMKYGYTALDLKNAQMNTRNCQGYLELHIEQGNILDNGGEKIGIVSGIVGLVRYIVHISGCSNHAGTTMMNQRDDALVKAASLITWVNKRIKEYGQKMVATVGEIHVYPNVPTVIPGEVSLIVEVRGLNGPSIYRFVQELTEKVNNTAGGSITCLVKKKPVTCSSRFMEIIKQACLAEELKYTIIQSGATHDGNSMALQMPIGMIFVPSKNGLSHCKEEWTSWEDLADGVQILYDTLVELAT